jgi:hypothetical protein
MALDTFIRMLPKLSKEINPSEFHMVNGLQTMLAEYFEPLYRLIMKKAFFNIAKKFSGSKIEPHELADISQVKLF